ncbi:MAG TPA: hypothetical protein VMX13_17580 [Sedimentisphaerales bacterium]|nr:hypothetical protein [Sedimentisphaerales bacterium]
MKNKPYKRKPGDFEIRILSNGRVVMIAPDEMLLDLAKQIESKADTIYSVMETAKDAGKQASKSE